ncbi:MAG: cadherin repeat domain-containing protein [Helicobacteraceae bacterium]|jgi:hypothetical protein|nr:cadherin repeat domain-containing protein [Helicobacteraceae bacterium]
MIKQFIRVLLVFTALIFSGCGEADYSFETVQKVSGLDLIKGDFGFTSSSYVVVDSAERFVIDVTTDTTDNVKYQLMGGENGELFTIDATTGRLSFIVNPLVNLYEVIVVAEDSGSKRAVQIVQVQVVPDITKALPLISTTQKNYAVLSFNDVILTVDAQPADRQSTLTYTIEGIDKAFVSVDTKGKIGFIPSVAEASGKRSFRVDVVVTDGYGNISRLKDVVITKVNLLSEIQPIVLSTSFKIVENAKGNAAVEVYTANGVGITQYTLGGIDAEHFAITNEGVLSLTDPQDYEKVTLPFAITLQVEDANGHKSVIQPITVTIVDIDETFLFSGIRDLSVQAGSSGVLTTVEAVAKTLQDGIEKNFTLEQGSAYFTIDTAGVITWKAAALKDTNITVQVAVASQLNGSRTLSLPFNVAVVDDPAKIPPTIDNNYLRAITVVETEPVLMSIQATVNGDATFLTYALIGTDANKFTVEGNGNIVSNVAFDEAGTNVYAFAVEVTDNNGNVVSTDTVTVTLLQDPDKIRPVIQTTTLNIAENSVTNMNILISSEGNGVINTYLISGDDSGLFTFDAAGLRFNSGADFESMSSTAGTNSYRVSLQVRDTLTNLSDTKAIVVNISDIDETLQFTSLSNFTPTEGITSVGTIKANGKDATPVAITYTLHNHKDIFALDANTGVLTFKSAALLGQHFDLNISAQSQFNGSFTSAQSVIIDVVPLSYAITFTPQGVAYLDQNSVIPVPIEAASAAHVLLTYAMAVGTDPSIFTIDYITGVMTVTVPAYVFSNDPEANIYRGAVVASDGLGHSATQQGELHVIAVDGLPVFVTSKNLNVNENDKSIVQLAATSPIGSPLTYSKVSGSDVAFFNVTSDGLLTFNIARNFEDPQDANQDNVYEVDVRVTDTLHPVNTTVQRFMVTVVDVNDAPSNITFANGTVYASVQDGNEGSCFLFYCNPDTITTTNLSLSATASPSGGLLYSSIVSNPDSSIFSMPANGQLRVDAAPVSNNITYDIVIDIREDKGETTRVTMHVTILD